MTLSRWLSEKHAVRLLSSGNSFLFVSWSVQIIDIVLRKSIAILCAANASVQKLSLSAQTCTRLFSLVSSLDTPHASPATLQCKHIQASIIPNLA